MSESLENIKEQIVRLTKRNPACKEILDFYEKIVETQEDIKPTLNISPADIRKDLRTLQIREGFPLINREDFILDIFSSTKLFESICHIGKNANEKMMENIQAIEDAIISKTLDPEDLLDRHYDKAYLDNIVERIEIDEAILKFLIHMSIKPSIRANVAKLKNQFDLRDWLRGYCPICGSFPHMSELRGEGQRYFLCSFCDFKWIGERLKCPFCENSDHEKLRYFYAEGQEAYRVDVCEGCKQYIKTVDTRKLDYEPDLNLEDIVTIHLDIMASEKGFNRPVPNPWGP